MNPEEVLPQVVARTQKSSKPAHSLAARQQRERAIVKRVIADLDQLVEKLIEMMHRFGRIRRFGNEASELFDHADCKRQSFLLRTFSYLAARLIRDDKLIFRAFVNGPAPDRTDIDSPQRK